MEEELARWLMPKALVAEAARRRVGVVPAPD
jgi:hypothetical protein